MNEAIIEIPGALDWLHARYFAAKSASKNPPRQPARATPLSEDGALIDKIRASKQGPEFDRLWFGDAGEDASGADFRLCGILAFWTGNDAQRIDRLFRQSGLFQNEGRAAKWDRKHHADGRTYGQGTIDKAIAGTHETYRGSFWPSVKAKQPGKDSTPLAALDDEIADSSLIKLEAGELPRNLAEAMAALMKTAVPIYQRAGGLVRPVILDAPKLGKAGRVDVSALILMDVVEPWLQVEITRAARLEKYDGRSDKWVPTNCPAWLAKSVLASAGAWPFPPLAGILEAPTLRPDGSLLNAPGYDLATGLYLHLDPGLKVKVRDRPTREQAIEAAKFLLDMLVNFPFEDTAALAVALAAILTGLVRRILPTAPGFAFDAPTPGSGKTLLADIVALIATGRRAPILNQALSDEETEKRIASFLLQGHTTLNLDNIERPLSGELLCSMLTAPTVTVRVLGESRSPAISTNLVFMTTGNNVAVRNDLSRRVLVCRLDPRTEKPDQRQFDVNLYDWIPKNRGRLISAALTILKAYEAAGRPDVELTPYGSFDEWSALVRAALVWVGYADPCQTRTRLEGADHITGELGTVLAVWHRELGSKKLTVREVVDQCGMAAHAELKVALLDVASSKRDGNSIDTKRLSHWLRKVEHRVIDGLRFGRAGAVSDRDCWQVERVGEHRRNG